MNEIPIATTDFADRDWTPADGPESLARVERGPTGDKTCIDTVPSGPVIVGAGAGVLYNLTPAFALTLGTNALLGFTKFTFHVDLNAGVAVLF